MPIKDDKNVRISRGNVRQVFLPLHIVLAAISEPESGAITVSQAMEKYDVKRTTIKNWLKKYSQLAKLDKALHRTKP